MNFIIPFQIVAISRAIYNSITYKPKIKENQIPTNIIKLCLFQDPKLAENNAGIVNVFGYKIMLMLMFRVNPNKIKINENNKNFWIFNPTHD